ncbi:hypothetical protein EDC04DRAFT_355324 [Pisolithus marmoratus]|nr:hypothetical protein EDC04DRAFT_355324 [Pisolithus marmoratus]
MQSNNLLRICSLVPRKRMPSCVAQKFHKQGGLLIRTASVRPISLTHRHSDSSGSVHRRLKTPSATASQPVSSDQLGFVPKAPSNPGQSDIPTASVDDSKVSIFWSAQNWSRFHHIWLRDHCRCLSCFHR